MCQRGNIEFVPSAVVAMQRGSTTFLLQSSARAFEEELLSHQLATARAVIAVTLSQ